MRYFALLTRHGRLLYLVIALLAIAGIRAALSLPSSIYPELRFSRITVVAQGTALGTRAQLYRVTIPLENAIGTVPGVERIRSRTIRGASELSLFFAPGTNMTVAQELVQQQINQTRSTLPPEIEIEAERMLPSLFPIVTYNVLGPDPPALLGIATNQIRPALASIPGLGRVEIQAEEIPQVQVIADPQQLGTLGLSYLDLATAIENALGIQAIGRLSEEYREKLIVSDRTPLSIEDVGAVVVRGAVHVSEVATVQMGIEDRVRLVRGDGRPAVLMSISRQAGGNTLTVVDSVDRTLARLQARLPEGVRIEKVYDQASLVRAAVRSVRDAIVIGALLAVAILYLFLQHGRITAISALCIPLTIAITIFAMKLLGESFNLMTLGGMAIAIGLIIDDAVVVTENIARHLALTPDRFQAIGAAVAELIWPVSTSTLTSVVVFLPLGLLQGVVGQFFTALSTTLVIAVLISLGLALTLVPLLSNRFVRPAAVTDPGPSGHHRLLARFGSLFERLTSAYDRALSGVLRHTRLLILVAIGLLVCGIVLYRLSSTGFLPVMDEGAFVLDYSTPSGTSLEETDRQLRTVESILGSIPEIESMTRRTGAEMGLFATETNTGDIVVRLKSKRSRSIFTIMNEAREAINRAEPRLQIEFVQILSDLINDLSGSARALEIKLFGDSTAELVAYARTLAPRLAAIPGVVDLDSGTPAPTPELRLRIGPAEAARIGLDPLGVAQQAQAAMLGTAAGQLPQGPQLIEIRVRATDAARFDPQRLGTIPIFGPARVDATPLGAIATFTPGTSPAELLRENERLLVSITGGVEGRSLSAVMNEVRAAMAAAPPPLAVQTELAGEFQSQRSAFGSLLTVLTLAALSVVAVMLIQFESFVEPLVILLAAPLSFVGGLLLLLLTRTPLNVSSMMGMILLIGLIVKNGIILLDFTRRRMRFEGEPLGVALPAAARIRLRPILMTTLCTLVGLLPLALGIGAGAELQRPLALAVIGGLALSTPITLFIVPSLVMAIRGPDYRPEPARRVGVESPG